MADANEFTSPARVRLPSSAIDGDRPRPRVVPARGPSARSLRGVPGVEVGIHRDAALGEPSIGMPAAMLHTAALESRRAQALWASRRHRTSFARARDAAPAGTRDTMTSTARTSMARSSCAVPIRTGSTETEMESVVSRNALVMTFGGTSHTRTRPRTMTLATRTEENK